MSETAALVINRIDRTFDELRSSGRIALKAYLTAGFPTLEASRDVILALIDAGATMVEIGMPFSDPLADGTTIQRANQRALDNGVTATTCLRLVESLREHTSVPLILMGYVNPMVRYGIERFVADATRSGVDGLIVPDVPLEESDDLQRVCDTAGLHLIHFLAPTSGDDRIKKVAERARGFIYCVSLTGVTGARASVSDALPPFLSRVRQHTAVPLVVGFGISRPEHVQSVGRIADGVIVASALIDTIERAGYDNAVDAAAAFIRTLRTAADSVERPIQTRS